jgi:formylglycine-generating enzyme required for sulfatase activity
VVLTRGFYIGKYEVTRDQYRHVMGTRKGRRAGNQPYWNASWDDANEFCARLSRRTGLTSRLPTEAEWEYACRAGADTAFCYGGGIDEFKDYAADSASAVGGKLPNAWGIHDMHGSVWEWCRDWYAPRYYARSPSADPGGPEAGVYRVMRGGANDFAPLHSRCATRGRSSPKGDQASIGFRVVCDVAE